MTSSTDALVQRNSQRSGLPDFYIVGSAKSGTTALYHMLRRHPQIFMPDSKEPWFFASELQENTPPRPEGTPRTLEEYRAWFKGAQPGQLVGEASVLYLWSQTAARAIAAVRPDARIIAILREPASLLRSLHLQFVETYIETELDFARALELEDERRAGRALPRSAYWPRALMYSEHARYVEQLRRYHEEFGEDNVLVLVYDDFRDDNDAAVRRVLRFLGVDDAVALESVTANPTVHIRARRLHNVLRTLTVSSGPGMRAVRIAVKAATPRTLRYRALEAAKRRVVYGEARPADEAVMAELRRCFAPEVAALSAYLGRDLTRLWGYDRIA
jgi:Sulfotransferase domain